MNKKAIFALVLAVLIPVICYVLVKYYSDRSVHMPPRYFYDDVIETTKRGKKISDTVWHKLSNISLTNQLGKKVTFDDAKGKIIVLDFFFTRCPGICPKLTKAMRRMQKSFAKNDSIVQFISVSVDPEYDSVKHLKNFADRYEVNHDNWWLVTGDKKEIYDFAIKEMKANIADVNVDTAFVHTEKFFLIDRDRVMRGFYDGLDSLSQARLARDIPLLMLEKNKKRTFREFLKDLFSRS
ncbi:MAG: SCO family protein [Chitinophagaceae bacterium]